MIHTSQRGCIKLPESSGKSGSSSHNDESHPPPPQPPRRSFRTRGSSSHGEVRVRAAVGGESEPHCAFSVFLAAESPQRSPSLALSHPLPPSLPPISDDVRTRTRAAAETGGHSMTATGRTSWSTSACRCVWGYASCSPSCSC